MNPSTSLDTRSNVGMAKPSPPVRQAGNIWCLLEIHGVCRRSVPSGCAQVKYKCRCRVTHAEQRDYCCRVEEIDGPSEESWREINAYLSIKARSLGELIQQLAQRKFGCGRLKVGDAFC